MRRCKPSHLEVSRGLDGSQALADRSGERVSKRGGGKKWDEANHGTFCFQWWSGSDNRTNKALQEIPQIPTHGVGVTNRPPTNVNFPNGCIIRPSKKSPRYQHMEWE